jgi:hypothetical protein
MDINSAPGSATAIADRRASGVIESRAGPLGVNVEVMDFLPVGIEIVL